MRFGLDEEYNLQTQTQPIVWDAGTRVYDNEFLPPQNLGIADDSPPPQMQQPNWENWGWSSWKPVHSHGQEIE